MLISCTIFCVGDYQQISNVANLMNITTNSKFLTDAALCPADALSAESETTVIVPGNECLSILVFEFHYSVAF